MRTDILYAVDRIESANAVLVDDAGHTVTLSVQQLPASIAEGAVLRVPVGPDGQPAWHRAGVDRAETARRRADARDRLGRLKKRDPGGDIAL